MKLLVKKIIIWLLFLILAIGSTIHARADFAKRQDVGQEEPLQFSSVELNLWPEFDQADMLVIYRITLPTDMFLPVGVDLKIPAVAGIPNAVAARQPGGALTTISYNQQAEPVQQGMEEWSKLMFQAIVPEIQVEYYDPRLEKDGNQRHFEYTWPGDNAVSDFKVEVQEPIGAKEMRIKPGLVTAKPGTDGLMYYVLDVGSLEAGETFKIEIDYVKSNNRLSSGYVPVEPSGPLDSSTQGRMNISSALPWILGSIGLLLILGGGLWYRKSGQERSLSAEQRLKSNKQKSFDHENEGEKSNVYCPTCGNRASPGDRFCRVCGKQLRSGI